MPSLPTSLIIVVFVIAWLVVLVPMFAGRRERVPDDIDDGVNMRVIDRRERRGRRRAVLSRTAMAHRTRPAASAYDGPAASAYDDPAEVGVEDLAEDADMAAGKDLIGDKVLAGANAEVLAEANAEVLAGDDAPVSAADEVVLDAGAAIGDDVAEEADVSTTTAVDTPWRRTEGEIGVADESRAENGHVPSYRADREPAPMRTAPPVDDGRYQDEAAPRRHGRGGYDPAAAKRADDYRFRQRRRVALALLVIGVVGAIVGLVGYQYGYFAAIGGGVLLVLYLAYLRRQTQIETEIRRRRAARYQRAQQIRPGYRPSVAEQVYAHRTGETPRPGLVGEYTVRSHARPAPVTDGRYGVPVDFDDDDPGFDDLEYYRPAHYGRRAG